MTNPTEPLPPSQAPAGFRAAFKRIDKRMDRMDERDAAIERKLKEIEDKLKRWGTIIITVATIIGSAIGGNVGTVISDVIRQAGH